MKTINMTVNGKVISGAAVEPRTQLADFVRDSLNLTGTHLGCEHGVCGACTLMVDGVPAPIKERMDSLTMADAQMKVAAMITGVIVFGRMWRRTIFHSGVPPCAITSTP